MSEFQLETNERLSRLETIIDSVNQALEKIHTKLDSQSKINWAPVAIGVTVFFTVAGSVSTIYNARISTVNTAVETLAGKTSELEKSAIADNLRTQVHEERIKELEKDVESLQRDHRDHARQNRDLP